MAKKAKAVMICGTGSHVGKSVITTALCRILSQDGFKVAPFKAQNMALNSAVTKEGGEIGRAQFVQAEAARAEPTVDMNPILLKPVSEQGSQVIVHGKPVENMTAMQYYSYREQALEAVKESFARLASEYDVIVLEGAGSPAEINLQDKDIVNMEMARLANAPVILVGDIERGGVFASLVGTLELLSPEDRKRIKGIIINKFRGDLEILRPGLSMLEQRTGVPVLGVLPYHSWLKMGDEDSLSLEETSKPDDPQGRAGLAAGAPNPKLDSVDIAIIRLPHLSNFTDFDPLILEPSLSVRYVANVHSLGHPDIIILPGTKATLKDMSFLKNSGLDMAIKTKAREGVWVVGICGGFQLMGRELLDPNQVESDLKHTTGLGLLDIITTFDRKKTTHQVRAYLKLDGRGAVRDRFFEKDRELTGYEIHAGQSELAKGALPLFEIVERSGKKVALQEGGLSRELNCWGTYIHGLFDNDDFRLGLINLLRAQKGLASLEPGDHFSFNSAKDLYYDRLAELVRANCDLTLFWQVDKKSLPEEKK
ncbi:MAG: cobyric acid synthase [bacterium]|nr:cobyric acid synthase [bacterium]